MALNEANQQGKCPVNQIMFSFPKLQDDGTGRVHVVGARAASGFELTVASEVFEESGRSLVRGTLDYLQGLKVCHSVLTCRFLSQGTVQTKYKGIGDFM